MQVDTIEPWIRTLAAGPGSEREYFSCLVDVLREVDFDAKSVEQGLGLLLFLTRWDFETETFSTVRHPAAGSVLTDATLVSKLFSRVGWDPHQWKANAIDVKVDRGAERWAWWWKDRVASSTIVSRVLGADGDPELAAIATELGATASRDPETI